LTAQAFPAPLVTTTYKTLIADGSWSLGQYADVTTLAASAPQWMQLLTDGVKLTSAVRICHPFHGGQFGWVGEIRQYKNGEWFKLKTTNDWVPNQEGEFLSCADAPSAGTYALFGYWIRPAGYVESGEPSPNWCAYSTDQWDISLKWIEGLHYNFYADVSNLPDETLLSYEFIGDHSKLEGPDSASGEVVSGEVEFVDQYFDNSWSIVTVKISALGCSKEITLYNH
jgi:hypothetical protein